MFEMILTIFLVTLAIPAVVGAIFVGTTYVFWYLEETKRVTPVADAIGAPKEAAGGMTAGSSEMVIERPSILRTMRLAWSEYVSGTLLTILYPFGLKNRKLSPGLVPTEAADPIMYVHGYLMNRSCFLLMSVRVEHEFDMHFYDSITLTPQLGTIEQFAEKLMARLEEAAINFRVEKFQIVAHSMGGLVTRYALANLGGTARISRVISLGTPHQGTTVSRMSMTKLGRSMRNGSDFIKRLEEDEAEHPERRVPWVAIATRDDEIVTPAENGTWERANANLLIEGMGHNGLLTDAELSWIVGGTLLLPTWSTANLANIVIPDHYIWQYNEQYHEQ